MTPSKRKERTTEQLSATCLPFRFDDKLGLVRCRAGKFTKPIIRRQRLSLYDRFRASLLVIRSTRSRHSASRKSRRTCALLRSHGEGYVPLGLALRHMPVSVYSNSGGI